MSTILKIQHLRGTAAEWTASNPVLPAGEFGVEIDTFRLKVGNGITPWNGLPYIGGNSTIMGLGTQQLTMPFQIGSTTEESGLIVEEDGDSLTTELLNAITTEDAVAFSATGACFAWEHNSNQYPIIKVLDSNLEEVEAQVRHLNINKVVICTVAPLTGTLVATITAASQATTAITTLSNGTDFEYQYIHNMGSYPTVRILDVDGYEIEFQVQHLDDTTFKIYTNTSISGTMLIS